MEPPPLEYSIEATSQEEGVAIIDLCSSSGGGVAPSSLTTSSASSVGVAPSFSMDLFSPSEEEVGKREAGDAKNNAKKTAVVSLVKPARGDGGESNHNNTSKGSGNNTKHHNDNGIGNKNQPLSSNNNNDHSPSTPTPSYYTSHPPNRRSLLTTFNLREYRHSPCIMTPLSFLVLLAILLSSLIGMILSFPQFLLGLLLGPLLRRQFWLVEFLYRFSIARWGHLKIMSMAGKGKNNGDSNKSSNDSNNKTKSGGKQSTTTKKLTGHSQTLPQRITVVPDRVYIHPIPQFMDNIAYLIVCTPPSYPTTTSPPPSSLPILCLLIDCGEATKILEYMQAIYERYYQDQFPKSAIRNNTKGGAGMSLRGVLCTHRHHDHTAGITELKKEVVGLEWVGGDGRVGMGLRVDSGCSGGKVLDGKNARGNKGGSKGKNGKGKKGKKEEEEETQDVYQMGHMVIAGGAVESVPHCNLFVKNGCFLPLPCVSIHNNQNNSDNNTTDDGEKEEVNDMNALISIEAIAVPSHTRGSIVYALRNRTAPHIFNPTWLSSTSSTSSSYSNYPHAPLQSHLFTGDAIFTGGGGVPFEADLEFDKDNFVKHPKNLKSRNGGSRFRPGAGVLSMERCFVEVLTRADGPWSEEVASSSISTVAGGSVPQAPITAAAMATALTAQQLQQSQYQQQQQQQQQQPAQTLLYPGHEYTTDLLMRQFDQKQLSSDIAWNKCSPSTFFTVASHYLVSAHRRGLPPDQKLLTVPTPLDRERVVNPNFRMLKRRGECVINALRLWYEFGAKNLIPEVEEDLQSQQLKQQQQLQLQQQQSNSIFTTVYTTDLLSITTALQSGTLSPHAAASQLQSLQTNLDTKLIGRRPIPSTLPSHKNVYLGVVALAVLGSGPCAVTVGDGVVMGMEGPVERTDCLVISKARLIAALDGLGLLANDDTTPKLQDIIHLLWKEARLDNNNNNKNGDKTKLLHNSPTDGTTPDIESSTHNKSDDTIELGLLKLALFGVTLNQRSKFCMPCCSGSSANSKRPQYDEKSWVKKTKLRRTAGELVRHDAMNCYACRDVFLRCPYSKRESMPP